MANIINISSIAGIGSGTNASMISKIICIGKGATQYTHKNKNNAMYIIGSFYIPLILHWYFWHLPIADVGRRRFKHILFSFSFTFHTLLLMVGDIAVLPGSSQNSHVTQNGIALIFNLIIHHYLTQK